MSAVKISTRGEVTYWNLAKSLSEIFPPKHRGFDTDDAKSHKKSCDHTLPLRTCYEEVYRNTAREENSWISHSKFITLLTFELSSFRENGLLYFPRCSHWYTSHWTPKSARRQNRENGHTHTDTQTHMTTIVNLLVHVHLRRPQNVCHGLPEWGWIGERDSAQLLYCDHVRTIWCTATVAFPTL